MAISVALTDCLDYSSPDLEIALDQVLAALGGLDSLVKPGQRVLLKPNLLTGNRPGRECVTRPELVRAIAHQDEPCLGIGEANAFACWASTTRITTVAVPADRVID